MLYEILYVEILAINMQISDELALHNVLFHFANEEYFRLVLHIILINLLANAKIVLPLVIHHLLKATAYQWTDHFSAKLPGHLLILQMAHVLG